MKRILLISFMLLSSAIITESWAQGRTVSGKVTDDTGEGIPGVNVILKGTTTGTTSDIDGNFRLSVPQDGGILVFTFVGMSPQEVEIGTRSVVDISMAPDSKQLTEVVVTAQGIERAAKALGYAVEKVDGDNVQQISEPDVLRGLQGKIAGVNIASSSGAPGSSTRITIRGNSSMLGNNQPLFVVDGVPYNNDFVSADGVNAATGGLTGGGAFGSMISTLDPNSIESITVLKGGSAAALYGARAANGVVVITTKAGSPSASKKGLEVTFSSSFGIEKIANLPDYQNSYGTGTDFSYAQFNGSWGAPFVGATPYATLDSIPHWYGGREGMEAYDNEMVAYQAYPNNVEDFFQDGQVFENSLTINGGNERSVVSLTLSQLNQTGFVPETEYSKFSISAGARTQLDNKVSVGTSFSYTRSEQLGALSGVGALGSNNPSAFARTLFMGRNWDLQGQPYQNPVDNGSEFFVSRGQANNPYWAVENTGISNIVDRYVFTVDAAYDFTDWLSVTGRLGTNGYNTTVSEFQRPNGAGEALGQIQENNVRFQEINTDLIISLNKEISTDLSLTGNFGWNVNQRTTEGQRVVGNTYVVFDIDDLDNLNSLVPNGGTYEQRRLIGLYGDISLGYKDWAFLNLTARNDWSSTLPVKNNSFFYPAASVSVIATDALNINSSVLDFLKLRVGVSQVGNDTDPYLLQDVYLVNDAFNGADDTFITTTQKPLNDASSLTLSNVARNPNLKPENTTEIELGTEIKLFNGKLGLDVAVYKKNTTDQIVNATVADETGYTTAIVNAGEIENKGIEIAADVNLLNMSNGFRWDVRGTFTHNKNTIISTGELDEIQFGSSFAGSVVAVHRAGQEYGLILGSVSARDDEGNLLIDPSNGQLIRSTERQIVGNPNPDFIAGFVNTFSFRGLSVRAVIDWKQGGDIYSNTVLSMLGRGVLESSADREQNYIIPGVYGDATTEEPLRGEDGEKIQNVTMIDMNSLYFGESFAINGANEWNVYDGTVVRLREIAVAYQLPSKLLERTPFGAARISFTGRNLWYLAPNFPSDTNYDPETNQFANRNNQGIEFSTTPSAKRYSVNLQIKF